MFDSSRPPLLVQPVGRDLITLFSPHEGYNVHYVSEEQALVCYKDGWTFPLSVQQQKYVNMPPLLMVKDSGGVTSTSSTTTKGYSHKFCTESGQEPVYNYKRSVFPEEPETEWMFIQDTVTMIWFQYGCKTQFLGGSGHDIERIYYGKLLIRKFDIIEDIAPGFDKKADNISSCSKQLRVGSSQLYNDGWNVDNEYPEKYLKELLLANKLERYEKVVLDAFSMASGS